MTAPPSPPGGHPPQPPAGVRTMSAVRWVIVALAAAAALFSVLGYAGVHLGGGRASSGGQLYYCPMHPSVVQDHPGECPICSMTLVPKPEGKAAPSPTMKPAPQPMKPVPGLAG